MRGRAEPAYPGRGVYPGVAALMTDSLEVRRGTTVIVSSLTWTHEAGRVAWLIGPNGAGKSSLMRVLAGLDRPAAGSVLRRVAAVGEERRSRGPLAPVRRRVVYYHPAMSLPPEAMASSFARLADRLAPDPRPIVPDRALGRKRCGALSTGEEKRLLLGPLLARPCEFLFLDEPYEHLSREARLKLTDALVRIARRAVVLVATNQDLPEDVDGPVRRMSGAGMSP